jgi:polyisoprenoid-binding protein YceI
MVKLFATAIIIIATTMTANAQLFKGKPESSSISFFSKATMEDIDAINKNPSIVLKTTTNDIQFGVPMIGFKFKSALMETHFNETYVESAKYPTTVFKGKIVETIDFTKDGEHKVTVKGPFTMHGVTKDIETTGTIAIKGTEIHVVSAFKVKLIDYKIDVPTNKLTNISEIIEIKVDALLVPLVKK